jgi:hypothetical protein
MAANVLRWQYLSMSANPTELFTAYIGLNKPAEPESSATHPERRKRARTKLHWPVLFFRHHSAEAVESLTQDLSSGGFYCLSKTPFTCGERILCTLKIPTYDPGGKERERTLECEVRVMRVEATAGEDFYGIACRIDDYRFAHSNSTVAH